MDLERIIVGGLVTFSFGLLLGVLLEKYREQKRYFQQVLSDYLKALQNPNIANDEFLRFGALQRAGIWRLSFREMKDLAAEVKGRGFSNPFEAWSSLATEDKNFPKGLFDWAQKNGVDFSHADSALRKMAEEFDAKNLPKPPKPRYTSILS